MKISVASFQSKLKGNFESAGALKKAIKEVNRHAFDHVDADTLVLWNASKHFDETLEDTLPNLSTDAIALDNIIVGLCRPTFGRPFKHSCEGSSC